MANKAKEIEELKSHLHMALRLNDQLNKMVDGLMAENAALKVDLEIIGYHAGEALRSRPGTYSPT